MSHGLDHLVLAARDLDRLADRYRRMGFTVGARNRHPWGTLNHIVQMPGTFLELISTEPGFVAPAADAAVAPFAGFLDRYLAAGDGFAMLVLESGDSAAEQARLSEAGLAARSTFRFERGGKRPDGTEVHLAFTLAFAAAPHLADAGLFFCEQHYPENFWNPAFQAHANGVTGVAAVTLVSDDPAREASRLARIADRDATPGTLAEFEIRTPRGTIEIASRARAETLFGRDALPAARPGPHWIAARFSIADRTGAAAALEAGRVRFTDHDGRLVVPAAESAGVALAFA